MNKRIYRIKKKSTGEYMQIGYARKTSWLVYPSEAIKNNRHQLHDLNDYEVEVFEMKHTDTITCHE
jgi:hypothetical protein